MGGLDPGTRVAGRFQIERTAGVGGMGAVYRAVDLESGSPVALKVLGKAAAWQRMQREVRILAELSDPPAHPAIVRYITHGDMPEGGFFLAMEWIDGECLYDRLERQALTVVESVALVRRVALALGAAHARGVVHRDLKPQNLMLENDDASRVRLIDFGIARGGARVLSATTTGTAIGTPAYMAPEQARGESDVDARVDVFALGCVLFECLTGRVAFMGIEPMAVLAKVLFEDAPRPSDLCADVPDVLDAIVARMLAKDRRERPPSGAAVAKALDDMGDVDDHPTRRRIPRAPIVITRAELRMVSVVILRRPAVGEAETIDASVQEGMAERLVGLAKSMGARVESLLDGSLVFLVPSAATPSDQAAAAASCALGLRSMDPEAAIAVATGLAEVGARIPVGEAIDRAAYLVELALRVSGDDQTNASDRVPVFMDTQTAALLDDRFALLRTKEGALLLGRSADNEVRTLLGRPTVFVGRDAEMAALEAAYSHCVSEPTARTVLVTAAAGMGKSRLRHELLQRLRSREPTPEVWMARAEPVGIGSTFGLAAQVVRRAAGVEDAEPAAVRRDRLRARVARHVAADEVERVTMFLAEMIGAPLPGEHRAQLQMARRDAMLMGDQMRRAWQDFVGAECCVHPVALVLEDLHWGDWPSVKLIDDTLRIHAETPLFVLALARPEVHEVFPDLWTSHGLQVLTLAALSRRAGERIVRDALGARVADAMVARLIDRSAGNAFYLEELVRAAASGDERPPDSLIAMVQGRLDAFEPDARRVLRAASVFGQVFWQGGLAPLLGGEEPAEAVARWLVELERREVVARCLSSKFTGEVAYAFRHGLVRDAAYAMLTDSDRRLGHLTAADWLEQKGEVDAMTVAEHFELGGDVARASESFARAAEQALEGNDLEGTIARAQRAAPAAHGAARAALLRAEGEAHRWRGEHAEATRCAKAAMKDAAAGSFVWLQAVNELTIASWKLGKLDRLSTLADELRAISRADNVDRAVWARTTAILCRCLLAAGREGCLDDLLPTAEQWAHDAADAAVLAHVHAARATHALHAGDLSGQVATALLAEAEFEEAGDLRHACQQRVTVGYGYLELGAYEDAERMLRAALRDATRMGLSPVAATARNNLGWALARLGRLEEARDVELAAITSYARIVDPRMEGCTRFYFASILADLHDLESAEREARRAIQLLAQLPPLRSYACAVLGSVLLRLGRVSEASVTACDGLASLNALGRVEEGEAFIRLTAAESLQASGEELAARATLSAASDRLLERADRIADPEWRHRFLNDVPEHARTLALAGAWFGPH